MNFSSLFLQCLFVFPTLIGFCFVTTTLLIRESKGEQIGMGSANLSWAQPWLWLAGESAGTNCPFPYMASDPPGDLLAFFHGSCITLKAISKVAPTCRLFSISVFVTLNIVLLAKANHLAKLRVCVRGVPGGMNKRGLDYRLYKPLT